MQSLWSKIKLHGQNGDLIRWARCTLAGHALLRSHILRTAACLWKRRGRLSASDMKPYSILDKWLWASFKTWDIPAVKSHGLNNDLDLLEINEAKFAWPKSASKDGLGWIYQEVFMPSWKNPHSYERSGFRIMPGDSVLDLGACEGFFTIMALRRQCNVVAFEPVPLLAESLKQTGKWAGGRTFRVINCLVSDSDGLGQIQVSEKLQLSQEGHGAGCLEVPKRKLDALFAEGLFNKVDFIKIDVEGAEQSVLRGASTIIKTFRPRIAAAVYHSKTQADEVEEILRSIDSSYIIRRRGVNFGPDFCDPRPMMLYAM